jgi:hypothetical protein
VGDLSGHIIIAGFGRVGQMVSQLLSERLIQFVALDVRSDRVQAGRAMNLPVYFGDAGSAKVSSNNNNLVNIEVPPPLERVRSGGKGVESVVSCYLSRHLSCVHGAGAGCCGC